MSLRQRLLLQLFITLAVSLAIGAAMTYWRASEKVKRELHAALTVGEQVLIDAIKEIERSPAPYQQMRIVIERFSGGRHLRISLLDKQQQRIAASRLEMPDDPAPEWFFRLMADAPESARVKLPSNVPGYDVLLIEADARNEVQEFWEELQYAAVLLVLLAGAMLGLVYWTLGRELKPLQRLNAALSKVADGDFSMRVSEAGPRDLKAVGAGFNNMAERLQRADLEKVELEAQLANVQDDERVELARDLHDELGPLLFAVEIDASAAQAALKAHDHTSTSNHLDAIREAIALSKRHVLQMLGRLRSGMVDDLGLRTAVREVADFWMQRKPGLKITVDVPDGVNPDLDTVIFRIVQESISNAVRHGSPNSIDVLVAEAPDGIVRVTVADDGCGLKSDRQGHGLTGMRERVHSRNGALIVRNRSGRSGTLVTADLPINPLAGSKNATMQSTLGVSP